MVKAGGIRNYQKAFKSWILLMVLLFALYKYFGI